MFAITLQVDGKLLCWLCTLAYRRALAKAKQRKEEDHHRLVAMRSHDRQKASDRSNEKPSSNAETLFDSVVGNNPKSDEPNNTQNSSLVLGDTGSNHSDLDNMSDGQTNGSRGDDASGASGPSKDERRHHRHHRHHHKHHKHHHKHREHKHKSRSPINV